jgi:hypothetical protein
MQFIGIDLHTNRFTGVRSPLIVGSPYHIRANGVKEDISRQGNVIYFHRGRKKNNKT